MNRARGSTMTGCASTNTIAALLAGAVDATAAERLELHLDTCPACRRLVADLGRGLSAIDGGPRGPASELPLPGDTIGRYEIRRAIGVGGMGVVYEAQDTTLDRRVAIKLLRPELVESASLLAEARAMARLTHPNIATVHDAGTANGHVYVCMEFVAGSTLRAYRSERARSWREVVALYVAAGEGLAYVHRAGIVHRDFKPDNVLVDREGRVRVTDFGLARIVGDCARAPHAADAARAYSRAAAGSDAHCGSRIAVGSRPGVGSSRVIAGTPAYMAPEQRRGERIDARADQYAFCVSLREALGDAAPSGLVRVLERGLAELPADRYPAMDDLLAAIARGLSRKRRRIALATIAVTALVALVASMPRPTKIVRQLVDRPTPTNEMARANVDGMTRPANGIAGAANGAANGIAANGAVNVPAASGIAAANANALSHAPSLAQAAARAFASHRSAADAPFALADIASSRGEQIGADPNELPAGACDDGSPRTCAWFPPYCPATTIPAIVDGCWTCADAQTCTPLGFPRTCNDGSKLRCSQPAPICSGHRIPAIHNGCWTCADPFTCPSRPTITRSPQPPPAGSNSGSNGTPTCGNGMCESGEDHASCASDCCELGGSGSSGSGGCAAACGNGMCESGEDHASCANDCCETTASGSCVPVCGNGFCEVDEVCAADC